MPLSRAEIQKGYRERKKAKEGESYLRKERTRRMKYYELSTKERKRRNKQNAERVKKHREKRKTEVLQAEEDNIGETSGYETWNEVSCHCDQCFLGDNPNFDHGWKVQSLNNRTNNLKINTGEDDKLAEEADKVMEQPPTTNERKIDLIEGEYVAAKYDRTWYIAKILQIDDSDEVERWENTKIAETHSYSKIASTNETIESDDCYSVDNVPVDLEEIEIVYTENVIDSPRLEKDWRCGRRLIELGVLADDLSACKKCGLPLQLSHCQGITNFGRSAMLKIPCMNSACKMINNVATGKRHNKIWDANTKLAAAVQHTGIDFDQISGILAELNMPPISRTLLSSRQVEIGKGTECIASLSMQEEVMATNM
uniref:Mutator-like transposase domain-containing protein n=1 Tax=Magallana gigas TaxID=29159 RepID=A0A8W8NXR6_MAGGI